jgi:glycosyltransferase involved in cell wall biosynthesis
MWERRGGCWGSISWEPYVPGCGYGGNTKTENSARRYRQEAANTKEAGKRMKMDQPLRAGTNKIVCFTLWFAAHNNIRHATLFCRLEPVVRFYKVILSRHRLLRVMQYRLWQALGQNFIYPGVLYYLRQRYETLFATDYKQIQAWPKDRSVVVDLDDPFFSPAEVRLLNLPQVKAVIVTTEKAKMTFEQLGVTRPIFVIPQGVAMEQIDPCKIDEIRKQFREDGNLVIGYHAPTLTLSADGPTRAREGQDDLDFLFGALENARKVDPRMRLWLFGTPSESVKKYAAEESWIKLFGYIPLPDLLSYISNVDIGVYPRTWMQAPGRFSVKLAQFMACGVPVVSTDLDESFILKEASSGIICKSPEDFSVALMELAQSAQKRDTLGRAGRNYARAKLDWLVLIPIYMQILNGV